MGGGGGGGGGVDCGAASVESGNECVVHQQSRKQEVNWPP